MLSLFGEMGLTTKTMLGVEGRIFLEAIADDQPTLLHALMFIPNIQQLCDDEQQARWLPEALSWRMIGCYAQTEVRSRNHTSRPNHSNHSSPHLPI